jgi:hypothetical protein
MEMDSRPSDAIALALRVEAPIYVAEEVMNEAGRVFEVSEGGEEQKGKEGKQPEKPKELSRLKMLDRDLEKAVKEERYEDAAGMRDEIKRLRETHSEN